MVLALLASAMPAAAGGKGNVLTVGLGQQYATIQAAVDAARPGSRILVYPGVYDEAVSVSKNNLQILAQGKGVFVAPPDTAGFEVNADHVTIQGFEIRFGQNCAAGISFQGSHNTFADNSIRIVETDCMGPEALVCADSDGGSDYNIIERNTIRGGAQGISIVTDAVNTGDVIRDNTVESLDTIPIAISNGRSFLVSGNIVDGADTGICIAVSADGESEAARGYHTVVNNTMRECFQNGISLHAGNGAVLTHNRIAGNAIQGCGDDGLALEAESGASLTYNEVISNSVSLSLGANGMLLAADPDAEVSDNLIRDNLVYHNLQNGIYLEPGADRNRILHNEVQTNRDVGIRVAGDDNLIVGNWAHGNGRTDIADLGEGNKWRNNTYTPRVGWAVGHDTTGAPAIARTVDGGLTWQAQGDLSAWTGLGCQGTDVSAVDDQTAWVVVGDLDELCPRSAILHTTDGGATWVEQNIPPGLAGTTKLVKGLSRSEAWAASWGGTILHTTDGGVTWNVVPHPAITTHEVNRIDAIAGGNVWIADYSIDYGGNPFMFHTLDNGLTWRQEPLPDVQANNGVFVVSAYSPQIVWSAVKVQGDVYRTTDGGAQWVKYSPPGVGENDWDDICAASAGTVWGVQTPGYVSGTIFWVHVAGNGSVDSQEFRPADKSFSYEGITCLNDRVVWAVGWSPMHGDPELPWGVIVSTVDGGQTWVQGSGPTDILYWKVSFVGARR
jgi:parallel beta-helix repeat protein